MPQIDETLLKRMEHLIGSISLLAGHVFQKPNLNVLPNLPT
jgi:hypothetical protein